MRDINRIRETLDRLEKIWMRVPDWRFMQLICNFQRFIGGDGFYLEEEQFINRLNEMLDECIRNS